jgi:hypothetical protein
MLDGLDRALVHAPRLDRRHGRITAAIHSSAQGTGSSPCRTTPRTGGLHALSAPLHTSRQPGN